MRRYLLTPDAIRHLTQEDDFDVIIIGSGIAGLYASLHIDSSKKVAVITKANIEKSNSWYAQGGIAAVMSHDDSSELHIQDTLKAGAGMCDPEAVEVLVKEGPENIRELISMNVPFDVNAEGELQITREGGHRMNRIVHCGGDATGRETTKRLGQIVMTRPNITVLMNTFLVDILTDEFGAAGAVIFDTGLRILKCRNIILGTGGIGQIYKYTTNPAGAIGDGIAAAYRAGAVVERMEMVQFHPTTLIPHGDAERLFLISEAVRGEGGILRNAHGEAFMKDKHELKDLAPRDIVTRAILAEMKRTGEPNMFLDVSSMTTEFFSNRFPTIFAECDKWGIRLTKDYIPVRPGQHYLMGGIKTNTDAMTNIDGLYACGEAAQTGIHGANRLASNSMLECLVFGRRCARHINAAFRERKDVVFSQSHTVYSGDEPSAEAAAATRAEIKELMSTYAGAVRTLDGLNFALNEINRMIERFETHPVTSVATFEVYNMMQVAHLVLSQALARKESVGAHYLVENM